MYRAAAPAFDEVARGSSPALNPSLFCALVVGGSTASGSSATRLFETPPSTCLSSTGGFAGATAAVAGASTLEGGVSLTGDGASSAFFDLQKAFKDFQGLSRTFKDFQGP